MYLTFEEYITMGGTLEETAFNMYEFDAEALIDWRTFKRIPKWYLPNEEGEIEYPVALKKCVFRLIELLKLKGDSLTLGKSADDSTPGAVTSQSNDGVSVSYNSVRATDLLGICKEEMLDIINMYLRGLLNENGRELLYRGLYPDE